jgi:hypothetical protein
MDGRFAFRVQPVESRTAPTNLLAKSLGLRCSLSVLISGSFSLASQALGLHCQTIHRAFELAGDFSQAFSNSRVG